MRGLYRLGNLGKYRQLNQNNQVTEYILCRAIVTHINIENQNEKKIHTNILFSLGFVEILSLPQIGVLTPQTSQKQCTSSRSSWGLRSFSVTIKGSWLHLDGEGRQASRQLADAVTLECTRNVHILCTVTLLGKN